MLTYTLTRFNRELHMLDLKLIEKDIPNLKIKVNKIENLDLQIKFKYFKQYNYFEFPNLPTELNQLIYKLNYDIISLNVRIIYPQLYPIQPPTWYYINCKNSFHKNINNFFKYKINCHNCVLSPLNWQPAISIEKDILMFLTKINIFNNLI